MSSTPIARPQCAVVSRAVVNRENARQSTGPRTEAGKRRSSLNAVSHGLTARSAVLPSEDPAAFEQHRRQFIEEYRPATPAEIQLVQELIDTAWRVNRIPLLEAGLLSQAGLDIIDAHRALATLGLHGQRLSRQFQSTLAQLGALQSERRERERRNLRDAAAVVEFHKRKGIPYDHAQDGFVFSKSEIDAYTEREMRLSQALRFERSLFEPPRDTRFAEPGRIY